MTELKHTLIPGLVTVHPKVFFDDRGYFVELFSNKDNHIRSLYAKHTFVQDNRSFSHKNVLRGLHYQLKHPQAKLLMVDCGELYDVVVDLRFDSPAFGQYVALQLLQHTIVCIPAGCAHGFLVTTPYAIITYKCTEYYYPEDQHGICWNDPDLKIPWGRIAIDKLIISPQDQTWPTLAQTKQKILAEAPNFYTRRRNEQS